MSETLWSATRAIARMIPGNIVVDGSATAITNSTSLTDTAAWYVSPTTLPAADYFNGGTIWADNCTSTKLEGRTAIIVDSSTHVTYAFTAIDSSTSFVTGDTYSASNRLYPRFILRQAVNHALAETGGVDAQNSTALTTVADQMAYDLPTGVFNVLRVEVATNSTSPWGYVAQNHWSEINDDIAFEENYQPTTTGDYIRLTYRVPFSELTSDTATINSLVDMNWVKWSGVAYCLRWKLGITDKDEDIRDFLVESLAQAERNAAIYRPKLHQMPREHKHSIWDVAHDTSYLQKPGKVRI